jgi:hypothetical protein
LIERIRHLKMVDPAVNDGPPSTTRVLTASVLSVFASVLADAVLVKIVTSQNHAIRDFSHFRFADYASLTVIGVVLACVAWVFVVRATREPRRLFFRLAIVVMLGLWIPDLLLFIKHENSEAVATLMAMHLVIAIITYNLLVHIASPRGNDSLAESRNGVTAPNAFQLAPNDTEKSIEQKGTDRGVSRYAWITMLSGVCAEFVMGIAALVYVPFDRPNEWLSHQGEFIYLAHAILGAVLAVGSVTALVYSIHASRPTRLGALIGLIGISLGAIGGVIAVYHSARVPGMALMFLGGTVAFFGYITPIIESPPHESPRPAMDHPEATDHTD